MSIGHLRSFYGFEDFKARDSILEKFCRENFESDQNQGQPEPFNFANVGNFVRGQLDASVNTTSNVK